MYPELNHQMMLERTARFLQEAERYRQVREANIRPPRPVRTAIELRLSAYRPQLERLSSFLKAGTRADWKRSP